jgi:hypothetical protein
VSQLIARLESARPDGKLQTLGEPVHILHFIGPETFTYRELVTTIGRLIGARRPVVSVPVSVPPAMGYWVGRLVGSLVGNVTIPGAGMVATMRARLD